MASTQDLAILSGDAYNDRAVNQTCGNWVVIKSSKGDGPVDINGFSATLYQNASTGELVISYAGTNDGWGIIRSQ